MLPNDVLHEIVSHLDLHELVALLASAKHLTCPVARRLATEYQLNARQTDAVVRFLLGQSFFLTGQAGVGKSYTLHRIMAFAEPIYGKHRMAVVASTSSAVNQLAGSTVCVQTLHSLLDAKADFDANGKKVWTARPSEALKNLRFVIADEVSMIEHELYDTLKRSLHPTCQIIATGDLLQLPPCGDPGAFPFVFLGAFFKKLPAVELILNVRASGADETAKMWREILRRVRFGIATWDDVRWVETHSLQVPVDDCALFTKRKRCEKLNEFCYNRLTTAVCYMFAEDEVETIKYNYETQADGATLLVRDRFYYDCVSLAEARLSVHKRTSRMRDPLTSLDYESLAPPNEAAHRLDFRVGMRVVLTRAIWSYAFPEETGDADGVGDAADATGNDSRRGPPKRTLVAANGEVGEVVAIMDASVLVCFDPRDDGHPRLVTVEKVKYRNGCRVNGDTLLQRRWVRKQVPLEKGYARTAHKAQGTTLTRPTHLDCADVFYKSEYGMCYVTPSIIYVLLGRARSVSQIHLARDKHGNAFDPKMAKPDAKALEYHTNLVSKYRPLPHVLEACGGDDVR